MRLAGKNELDWTLRIIRDRREPFDVGKNQVRPLVCCKTPRKSDSERIRTQNPADAFGWLSPVPRLLDRADAHKIEQL